MTSRGSDSALLERSGNPLARVRSRERAASDRDRGAGVGVVPHSSDRACGLAFLTADLGGTGRTEGHEEGQRLRHPHRMTPIEWMKGQRQLHLLWAWRERLCAEMPTTADAVDLSVFRVCRSSAVAVSSCSSVLPVLPTWLLESQSPSGSLNCTMIHSYEQSFMPFVPFMSFLFSSSESQPTNGIPASDAQPIRTTRPGERTATNRAHWLR